LQKLRKSASENVNNEGESASENVSLEGKSASENVILLENI